MSIKTKISLALAFLFTVIVGLVLIGSYYLNQLARDAQEIIKDNYRTLAYVNHMTSALTNWQAAYQPTDDSVLVAESDLQANALRQFQENLDRQLNNVTETGEQEMNRQLRDSFSQLVILSQDSLSADVYPQVLATVRQLNGTLSSLYGLNEESVLQKNEIAQVTAQQVITYMAVIGVVCVVIGLAFLIGFPGYIANPIRELTHSIEQIAQRNYGQRLAFSSSDEFGTLARSFNTMAEKLSEYENSNLAQILSEKKRTETVIRNMREAIVGLDEQKNILFANPTAQRLLSLNESELVGKYAPDIASVNDLMRHLIRELMEDTKLEKDNSPLKIVEDGKEQYYTKEILDVFSPESPDMRIGYVIVLKNITTFKELDLAKTNFIATISHELKTPIASIKMSAKLLDNDKVGPINQAQQELIHSIEEDGDRLLKITKELLDLTQVETGNIRLNPTVVAPLDIVDYALDAVRSQAKQKNVSLIVQANDNLSSVHADREKSAWVMVNLLSNAIRYSPEGREVIVSVSSQEKAVAFSVQDFGRGISPKFQERIFEKYFQTPNSEKTGSGLGLAISREFIIEQGGELRVSSQPGEGSTFTFTLPKA